MGSSQEDGVPVQRRVLLDRGNLELLGCAVLAIHTGRGGASASSALDPLDPMHEQDAHGWCIDSAFGSPSFAPSPSPSPSAASPGGTARGGGGRTRRPPSSAGAHVVIRRRDLRRCERARALSFSSSSAAHGLVAVPAAAAAVVAAAAPAGVLRLFGDLRRRRARLLRPGAAPPATGCRAAPWPPSTAALGSSPRALPTADPRRRWRRCRWRRRRPTSGTEGAASAWVR